jgi:hypothetical protein
MLSLARQQPPELTAEVERRILWRQGMGNERLDPLAGDGAALVYAGRACHEPFRWEAIVPSVRMTISDRFLLAAR